MSIYEKIEEIRRKPEAVRMRYVWIMVAISFTLIIAIWGLSFYSRRFQEKQSEEFLNTQIFDDLKEQKKSLDEYTNQYKENMDSLKRGLENVENGENVQNEGAAE